MRFFKKLRLWLRKESSSAESVEVEKSDANREVGTETDSRADCECSKNINELKSMKAYYKNLIQECSKTFEELKSMKAYYELIIQEILEEEISRSAGVKMGSRVQLMGLPSVESLVIQERDMQETFTEVVAGALRKTRDPGDSRPVVVCLHPKKESALWSSHDEAGRQNTSVMVNGH
jgi:hypothetical protein